MGEKSSTNAKNIKCPVLIYHGEKDVVINMNEMIKTAEYLG